MRPSISIALLACTVMLCATAHALPVAGSPQQAAPEAPPRDGAPQHRGSCTITGRVTAADDGSPLARVVLTLAGQTLEGEQLVTESDEEGRYEFRHLTPGSYHLMARRRGYVQAHSRGMRAVQLKTPAATARADLALEPAGAISGRVLDEAGEPMPYVQVQALRAAGGEPESVGRGRETDDRGWFRLFELEPGEYLVRAEPPDYDAAATGRTKRLKYVPAFAPGVPDPGSAQVIVIGRTREVSGIDIRLSRHRTHRLTGTVVESSGRPPHGAYLSVMSTGPGGMSGSGAEIKSDGRFAVESLPPGDYVLEVNYNYMPFDRDPDSDPEYGRQEISVREDLDDITIVTRPTATLSGEVVFEGAPPGFALSEDMRVGALALDHARGRASGAPAMARVGEDLRFTIRGIAGPSVIRPMSSTPKGWWLERVLYRGQEVIDVATEFQSSGAGQLDVFLVFTNRVARVTGRVTRPDGRAVGRARVFAMIEARVPGVVQHTADRFAVADEEGVYAIEGLTADRYLLAAEEGDAPWRAPYERLAASATVITVTKEESKVVNLEVTATEP